MAKVKAATGFNAPVQPDNVLGAIVGNKPKPRGQISKKLWEYIKDKDIQSKKDGRIILAHKDKAFRAFAGKDEIHMMKLATAVSKHVTK